MINKKLEKILETIEYSTIGCLVYRWKENIRLLPREIKWWFQKKSRGYSDCDLWDLDNSLGQHIVKCLKAFKKMNRVGIPCKYLKMDENGKATVSMKAAEKARNKDLQDMIDGFEFLTTKGDDFLTECYKKYPKNSKKSYAEYEKALEEAQVKAQKFVTNFNSLWD